MVKSTLHFFLPFLINIIIFSSAYAESTNSNKLLFVGNKNIPPVVYLEGDKPSGVAVDIVYAIAKHIPYPIEIQAIDWMKAQELVVRDEADVLIQINQTEERLKIYDFTDTLLESQFSIFVRTDRVGISGISSLDTLQVGVESAGLPRQILEKNPGIKLIIITNFIEGFKLLDKGKIDAVVVDYRVGSYILAENNIRNIQASGDPIAFSYSSFAVKKGNKKLLNAINNALKIIKADGTYQAIIDKWKPKEAVFYTREKITQTVSNVIILTFIILFLIVIVWIFTLKRELMKRKTAEKTLKEQYSTLSGIIDSTDSLIFSLDRKYRYTSFNKGHAAVMKAIYGAEIENGRCLFDYMTVPEDREKSKKNLNRALAGESLVEEAYSGEEHLSRKYFQVSHSPIMSENKIIGVAVFAFDMTERKLAENEIIKLNEDLDQRVKNRTAELEQANVRLQELDRLKSMFIASMSHELRTPLNSIIGFSSILSKEWAGPINQEQKENLDSILRSGKLLLSLINDVIDVSKIESGKVIPVLEDFDIYEVVREAVEIFTQDIKNKGIDLKVTAIHQSIHTDRRRLLQCLLNLISNAIKFTEKGIITVSAIITNSGDMIEISVSDTGIGIRKEDLGKLFFPFVRINSPLKPAVLGAGLGLYLSRKLITEILEGVITVSSTYEMGSLFKIIIPVNGLRSS